MEWIAQFEKCEQVSPDDWKMIKRTLKLEPATTMQQITDWAKAGKATVIELLQLETPIDSLNTEK